MAPSLVRLVQYFRRYRRNFAKASLFSVINKFFDVAPEILIGIAVDVVVQQQNSFVSRFGPTSVSDQLTVLAVLTFFIWVFESVFEYLYNLEWRNLAQTVQHELRLDTYRHVQNLDLSYFEDKSAGGLVSVLNDDINQLERFLDGGANSLIQVATSVILIGGVFFYLSPMVALWAVIPIPIIIYSAFKYQKKAEPLYAAVREKAGILSSRLSNNLSGIATIKSQATEAYELEQVGNDSQGYREANRRAIAVSSAFTPLIRLAILAGFISTLVIGGRMALSGALAVGSYSVLIFLTQRLLWPLTGLAQTVDLYQRAMASTDRVLNLLATPILIPTGGKALSAKSVKGELKLENITFAYGNGVTIFRDLSLEIPAGKTTALVGSTGSGKSSLAKLLLRFYLPQGGKICLDGEDIQSLDLTDLRRLIGFVGQDIFLFNGSIRDNIAYGRFDARLPEIVEAAKVAEADEFIRALPQGYDTVIGDRGQRLSGGQRQRIAIARAVLKNPPIMILDEATSAVDNETERLIQKSLERIAVGRTMIVIAHRLSTIRRADNIYVLRDGKIEESGNHESLVKNENVYAWLWKVQTGAATT